MKKRIARATIVLDFELPDAPADVAEMVVLELGARVGRVAGGLGKGLGASGLEWKIETTTTTDQGIDRSKPAMLVAPPRGPAS